MPIDSTMKRFALRAVLLALLAVPAAAAIRTPSQPVEPPPAEDLAIDATPDVQPAQPARPAAAARQHTLAAGETLWSVALKYGLSVKALKDANHFDDPETIAPGTVIELPAVAPYALGALKAEPASFSLPEPAESPAAAPIPARATPAEQPDDDEDPEDLVLPARQAHRPAAEPGPAGFLWPVDGHVMSPFGRRHRRLHAGVDLKAPRGTPIRAARDGRVVFSGRVRGHGRVLVLEHDDGFHTVYAHNQRHLVSVESDGERLIRAGETIALVGCSGNATCPHVHFEIRADGKPVNPLKYLADRP